MVAVVLQRCESFVAALRGVDSEGQPPEIAMMNGYGGRVNCAVALTRKR